MKVVNKLRIGIWLLVLAAAPVTLRAASPVLVVNNNLSIRSVTAETIELIFLGKKTLWESGEKIMPALPVEENKVAEAFISGSLKKTVSQYRAYWKRRLFSGGGTVPKTFRTTGELLDFVAKTPGAIGVVDQAPNDQRVKIVNVSK